MGQAAIADDNLVEDEENPEESWGEIVMLSTRSYTVHVCGKRLELGISIGRELALSYSENI